MGGYRTIGYRPLVVMCAFQHSAVAEGGRLLACSCTPLALSIVCSPAPLSSLRLRAVVSDESSNEAGRNWPGSEGWHEGVRRDERRSRDRVLFLCRVRLAAFLMRRCGAARSKNKSTRKRAGVSWCSGLVLLAAQSCREDKDPDVKWGRGWLSGGGLAGGESQLHPLGTLDGRAGSRGNHRHGCS